MACISGARYAVSGEDEHPEEVTAAIEALDPPIPPYAAFEIEPRRVYAPIIDDGVNRRVEVDVS